MRSKHFNFNDQIVEEATCQRVLNIFINFKDSRSSGKLKGKWKGVVCAHDFMKYREQFICKFGSRFHHQTLRPVLPITSKKKKIILYTK